MGAQQRPQAVVVLASLLFGSRGSMRAEPQLCSRFRLDRVSSHRPDRRYDQPRRDAVRGTVCQDDGKHHAEADELRGSPKIRKKGFGDRLSRSVQHVDDKHGSRRAVRAGEEDETGDEQSNIGQATAGCPPKQLTGTHGTTWYRWLLKVW